LRRAAACVALAGPTVLAFFSGGFFDEARLFAGIAACVLLVVAALVSPLPRSWPAWAAPGALGLLAFWVWLSAGWAPLEGAALADAQRVALYAVALLAATLLLGAVPRAVEPALALGALVVVGYGLAGRLLPGLVHLAVSRTALGRLEQPLTYWNAMGALAAMGFVLGTRVLGDPERPPWLRGALGAATVPLGLGVVLTFSRGTLIALAVGLAALCLLAPTRAQLRAAGLALGAMVVAAGVGIALRGVRTLDGSLATRETEGAAMLAVLALVMAAVVVLGRREPPGGVLARPWLTALAGAGAVALVAVALALAGAGPSTGTPTAGANPARLASAESNRYSYWRVALDAFAAHPLAGVGSGGFRVEWRRERKIADPARDAHSLYLETAAELGLVGLLLLAAAIAAVAVAAARARRRDRAASAGLIAALVLWAVHAGIDWDWEMPALTLVALALAAALSGPPEPAG
jgi:O-antigen ligase/polysaccharide polymerase Wzy-like membrane protein